MPGQANKQKAPALKVVNIADNDSMIPFPSVSHASATGSLSNIGKSVNDDKFDSATLGHTTHIEQWRRETLDLRNPSELRLKNSVKRLACRSRNLLTMLTSKRSRFNE